VRTVWGPTEPFEQQRGLLQRNPLSCLLFNIFIDPLVCALATTGDSFVAKTPAVYRQRGVMLPSVTVDVLAYADNLAAMRTTAAGARAALLQCVKFFDSVSMNINAAKTVYFSTRKKGRPISVALPDGRHVTVEHHDDFKPFRYLGVEMTTSLLWHDQQAILETAVNRMSHSLGWKSLTGAEAVYITRARLYQNLMYRLITGCATLHV
jgi:hypothetical protein